MPFLKRKKEEFKKTKPVIIEDISEVPPTDGLPVPEQIPEPPMEQPKVVSMEVPVNVDGDAPTLEELEKQEAELKQKMEEAKRKKEEEQVKQQPQVYIKKVAITQAEMYNDISDKLDAIEVYLAQLHQFLQTKLK